MPSCAVKTCRNRHGRAKKVHGVTYHRFPHDPFKKEKWIQALQLMGRDENWFPGKRAIVCSDHFGREYFMETKKKLVCLKNDALPIFKDLDEKKVSESNIGSHKQLNAPESMDICDDERDFNKENMQQLHTPQAMDTCDDNYDITSHVQVGISLDPEMQETSCGAPITEDDPEINEITDTPRKAKLKKIIKCKTDVATRRLKALKNVRSKYRRLQKKCRNLMDIIDELKKNRYINEEQSNALASNPEITCILTALQKKSENKNRPFKKYPQDLRKFALRLHFYSVAAYKSVRQSFGNILPHPKTIGKWYQQINGEPGFTIEAFELLKLKSAASEHKPLCNLVLDEMSIRQQSLFDGKKYQGYIDIGAGKIRDDCQQIASSALVFMIVCINGQWKLPIGYFLVNGLKAEQTTMLIKTSLELCSKSGIEVVSITFDGCPTHLSVMRLLGCEIDNLNAVKTQFEHPITKKPIVVLLDACHMLKLVRNSLESKKIIHDHDNKIIKWNYLVKLNELQNAQGLSYANKLKSRHILFRKQIMKVKLAAQLLSRSVAQALIFCEKELNIPEFRGATATSTFIQMFNDIFDILNTKVRAGQYGFKNPLCAGNKDMIFSFIDQAITYIKSLKILVFKRCTIKRKNRLPIIRITKKWVYLVESKSRTGFVGMIVCLESLKKLYSYLVEDQQRLKYIPSYKLSQDHLELLFGSIRSQGGYNNNPNAKQFKAAYKKLISHLELRSGFSGNAIPREEIRILNCSSVNSIAYINSTTPGYRHEDDDEEEDLVEEPLPLDLETVMLSEHLTQGTKQIVGYIAGYVVRSIIDKVRCEGCVASLLAFEKDWYHKLISLRDKGGLCYPSYTVFQICLVTENVIKNLISVSTTLLPTHTTHFVCTKTLRALMDTDILRRFAHHESGSAERLHGQQLIRAIVEKYTVIKMHHETALLNIRNKIETTRQLYNKLTLFKGL